MAVVVVTACAFSPSSCRLTEYYERERRTETQNSCCDKIDTDGLPSVSEATTGARDCTRWTYGREETKDNGVAQQRKLFCVCARVLTVKVTLLFCSLTGTALETKARMHHFDA